MSTSNDTYVVTVTHTGVVVEVTVRQAFTSLKKAVVFYTRMLRRHRGDHVRLVKAGQLPGMAPTIIAERFG